jgi:hypothetical protein
MKRGLVLGLLLWAGATAILRIFGAWMLVCCGGGLAGLISKP